MNHIQSAARHAGARPSCAEIVPSAGVPVERREVLQLVRRTRRRLGLSTGDILVLDSLLSFLPCRNPDTGRDGPIGPSTLLVIYASNTTLCARANDMDERVLRRHVARLVKFGLLRRRDSATGKRFPLKSRGRIVSAFGLDLTPLIAAVPQLHTLAQEIEADNDALRTIRAEALAVRARILNAPERLSSDEYIFVEGSKTILRRQSLTPLEARAIADHLQALYCGTEECPSNASELNPENVQAESPTPVLDQPIFTTPDRPTQREGRQARTGKSSAANGQIVRRKESVNLNTNSCGAETLEHVLQNCAEITALCPEVLQNRSCLRTAIFHLGAYLGIEACSLAEAMAIRGLGFALKALNYLIANAHRIDRPTAYLQRMVRDNALLAQGPG